MRVLITGGTGFIGKSLIERFKNSDIMLIGRDWYTDKDLTKKIEDFNPLYIIHAAAEIKNPEKTFASNVLMTNWLLESTKNVNYNSFIYIGSSSEYGLTNEPIKENQLLKPRNMYEGTKSAGTMLCQGFANEYDKPIAIVRPFSVYGVEEPENRLIPTLFKNCKNNINSNLSTAVHDFIYVDDFIDGLLSVLYAEKDIIKGDIVHFGTGVQYSNIEVFNFIKEITKSKTTYNTISNIFNKYDNISWVADIVHAKSKYKFNPKYNLLTGLKEIYERKYK